MRFTELPLGGAYVIDLEPITDERGFNARAWCTREFGEAGLEPEVCQVNVIYNRLAGTLRGFHYQIPPNAETKLFRVTRGVMYDVIVDLRPRSATFLQWTAVELHAGDYRMLYVPRGFGQAFQSLEDDTELIYQVSAFYNPDAAEGFRYDDPLFRIDWPRPVARISERDATWPDFDPDEHGRNFREVD